MLNALSPLDGRYREDVGELCAYFSEAALLKERLRVEVAYFLALSRLRGVSELRRFSREEEKILWNVVRDFSERYALRVKELERECRHDVKAVERFLSERWHTLPFVRPYLSFVHFGLTSEDVNNIAYGLLIQRALAQVIVPSLDECMHILRALSKKWKGVPLLALTHGQPATPTTVGKEFLVFAERLHRQIRALRTFRMQGKFSGAVGNFAAHRVAYPLVDWKAFGRTFLRSFHLIPLTHTTQINPHDDCAELSHILTRINTILLDCSRDMWLYIMRGVFRQSVKKGEVGSSTMPHKVNPIDFENAEGNLGLSTALFHHFAEKLPVSRLQRDLSDSTVQRNIGVAFGHHLLAAKALLRGFSRIDVDRGVCARELREHPELCAEALQVLLRRFGERDAYERVRKLTRGKKVTEANLREVVHHSKLPIDAKDRLDALFSGSKPKHKGKIVGTGVVKHPLSSKGEGRVRVGAASIVR